jgi:hypothetical protein
VPETSKILGQNYQVVGDTVIVDSLFLTAHCKMVIVVAIEYCNSRQWLDAVVHVIPAAIPRPVRIIWSDLENRLIGLRAKLFYRQVTSLFRLILCVPLTKECSTDDALRRDKYSNEGKATVAAN